MRTIFTIVLFALVLFVKAEESKRSGHHYVMGTPWYSEFLEDDDFIVSKEAALTPTRRKGDAAEKLKNVSTKKIKKMVDSEEGKRRYIKGSRKCSLFSPKHILHSNSPTRMVPKHER